MINIKPFNFNYEFLTIAKPQGKSITIKAGETVKAEVIDILPSGGVVLRVKGTHITVNTEIPLQKETSLLLKILDTPYTDQRLRFQIVAVLGKEGSISLNPKAVITLNQIYTLLNTENLKESFIKNIIEILPQKFNSMDSSVKNILVSLLLNSINDSKKMIFHNLREMYGENFIHINNLTPDKLQNALINTGIFFESKLKRSSTDIKEDLKFKLLRDISDKASKDMLRFIDLFQVVSRLTDGLFTFLPVIWRDLEDGKIYIKEKSKDGKKGFLCILDLKFSDIGDVQISLFLYNRDLLISIYIENQKFRKYINDDINELKEILSFSFNNIFIKFKNSRKKDFENIEGLFQIKV